jgi:dTDP-4-dehydrorhamnose reductase
MTTMKILLLGARGQLGHELAPLLSRRGELVAPSREQVDYAEKFAELPAYLAATRPALIVNCIAYNEVDKAEAEPEAALRVNRDAVSVLGDYARKERAGLVHFSTDFVFDGKAERPYVETDATNPLSAYGRSKLAGEEVLEAASAPAIVLRTAWVYSLRRKSFVSAIYNAARQREELTVVSDQVGNPTSARDLARVTDEVVGRMSGDPGNFAAEHRGVYHAAGKGHCNRYELARAIVEGDPRRAEQKVKRVLPVSSDQFKLPAARPAYAPLDCTKLERRFGVDFAAWQEALGSELRTPGS